MASFLEHTVKDSKPFPSEDLKNLSNTNVAFWLMLLSLFIFIKISLLKVKQLSKVYKQGAVILFIFTGCWLADICIHYRLFSRNFFVFVF